MGLNSTKSPRDQTDRCLKRGQQTSLLQFFKEHGNSSDFDDINQPSNIAKNGARMSIYSKLILSFCTLLLVVACSDDKDVSSAPKNDSSTFEVNGGTVSEKTLPNSIRVVALSIPESIPKLSVSVGVGSAHDPENMPGLAHFVEHMLFLGSTEYPDALQADALLAQADGYRNAYTAPLYTNYQLQANESGFEDAVKRLSRFFVSPLFTAALVDKEKNAIQNEYILRFNSFKTNRALQILNGEGTTKTNFSVGNIESLKNATAEDAKQFWLKYYSAQNITIFISGPQSLEELQRIAAQNFSDIVNKTVTLPEIKKDVPLVNKIVKIKNPEASSKLGISLSLKKTDKKTVRQAQHLISGLVGDETQGSLLGALQREGLADPKPNSLTAGIYDDTLSLSIALTPLGVENYNRIISLTLGFIHFLKLQPEPRYILNEYNGLLHAETLSINYEDLDISTLSSMNDSYNKIRNARDLFFAENLISFEPTDYTEALSLLDIQSLQSYLVINAPEDDLFNRHFKNTTYRTAHKLQIETLNDREYVVDGYYSIANPIEALSLDMFPAEVLADYAFPAPNPYIPQTFNTKTDAELSLETIKAQNMDVFFNARLGSSVPKTETHIYLFSPLVNFNDKAEIVKIIMMKNWLLANISQELYPFTIAGVEAAFNVMIGQNGLRIALTSWNDKSEAVTRNFISLLEFNNDEVLFQRFKQISVVSLDQRNQRPDIHLSEAQMAMQREWPEITEYKNIVESLTLADLKEVYDRFFKKYYTQAIIGGHYSPGDASAVIESLRNKWPSEAMTPLELETLKEKSGKTLNGLTHRTIDVPTSQSSYNLHYYQTGADSKKEELMTRIIGEWIAPEFYYELRTQQQLAYSLNASFDYGALNSYGLSFYLESSSASSDYVESEITLFIKNWIEQKLPLKTQEDINQFLLKLRELDEQNSKSISQDMAASLFLWGRSISVLGDETYEITIDELITFVRTKILENPTGYILKIQSDLEKEENLRQLTPRFGPQ